MSVQKTIATTDHHPIAWFSELQRREKNTFWACVGGWVLDAMDVQMFSFAIPAIIAVFAITNADAGLIGTATLLTSAFGGWFAGALSDRFGRVRTLQITIAWFAVFTFLCGFAQSYAQLFVFRAWDSAPEVNGLPAPCSSARLFAPSIVARPSAPCRAAGRSAGALPRCWRPCFSLFFRKR